MEPSEALWQHKRFKRVHGGLFLPMDYPVHDDPSLEPLRPRDFEVMLDGLSFFRNNPEIVRIWEFDQAAGPLQGWSIEEKDINKSGAAYWIISPFLDGRLVLHSANALRAGRFILHGSHGILFDSNLFESIVAFVETPESMARVKFDQTRTLLEKLIVRGYDFHLIPYLVEASVKSTTFADNGMRAILAILRLQTMDRSDFLATGKVSPDPAELNSCEHEFGTADLATIAAAQLDDYRSTSTPGAVDVALIALIKMVEIRRFLMVQKSIAEQLRAFDEFLFSSFGALLTRLRFVGLFYFAGQIDSWIRVQSGMPYEKAFSSLSNCAWDFHLSNIPIQLFADSSEEMVNLWHFCTRDFQLAKLLNRSRLRAVVVRSDNRRSPFFEYDATSLSDAFGSEDGRAIWNMAERTRMFVEQRGDAPKPLDAEAISSLLSQMTEQLRNDLEVKRPR